MVKLLEIPKYFQIMIFRAQALSDLAHVGKDEEKNKELTSSSD